MVDSISDSMYGLQGISAYSIGSYTQIDTSGSSSSGSSQSNEEDEEYDEMDLNQDGTVSSAEMIIYELRHGSSGDDNSQINSTSLSDALSAYTAA